MGDYVTQKRNTGVMPAYVQTYKGEEIPRSFVVLQPTQETYSFRSSAPDPTPPADISSGEFYSWLKQTTEDKPKSDTGHEFFTTRTSVKTSHSGAYVRHLDQWNNSGARGFLWPQNTIGRPTAALPPLKRLTAAEIVDFGTRAIKATTPTKPGAQLATTMSELALLLPTIPGAVLDGVRRPAKRRGDKKDKVIGTSSDVATSLAGEYLNWTFALAPTLSDFADAAKSLKTATSRLRQLQADSNKVVRRSFQFPDKVESTTQWTDFASFDGMSYGAGTWFDLVGPSGSKPSIRTTTTVTERTWFSGAYSFYFGVDESTLGRLTEFERNANLLVGSRVTAETLWELTPWSWLSDWYGTIGSSIANAERFSNDSLVLRYGYLMRERTEVVEHTVEHLRTPQGSFGGEPYTVTLTRVTKERVRASPYGFGLRDTDLSVKQWSILAALGMTKGPRARY